MPGALVSLVVALVTAPSIVAIEPPPEWGDEARAKVVESCRRALGDGRCVLAPSGEPAPPYLARLHWEGESLGVSLIVAGGDAPLAESSLHFSEADDEKQRWVAAGLLVAALTVAEAEAPETSNVDAPAEKPAPVPAQNAAPAPKAAEPVPPVAPPSDASEESPANAPRHAPVQLDLGAFGGPGLDGGSPRIGATLRGWLAPAESRWALTLGARGARGTAAYAETAAVAVWTGGSLGLGVCVAVCSAGGSLVASGEAVVERTELQLERAGVVDREAVWRSGARLGLTGAVRLLPALGLWASGDATLLRPEVAVRVDSTPTDQDSSIRWTAGAGLRFYLDPFQGGDN
jgi:hypothetical protein